MKALDSNKPDRLLVVTAMVELASNKMPELWRLQKEFKAEATSTTQSHLEGEVQLEELQQHYHFKEPLEIKIMAVAALARCVAFRVF